MKVRIGQPVCTTDLPQRFEHNIGESRGAQPGTDHLQQVTGLGDNRHAPRDHQNQHRPQRCDQNGPHERRDRNRESPATAARRLLPQRRHRAAQAGLGDKQPGPRRGNQHERKQPANQVVQQDRDGIPPGLPVRQPLDGGPTLSHILPRQRLAALNPQHVLVNVLFILRDGHDQLPFGAFQLHQPLEVRIQILLQCRQCLQLGFDQTANLPVKGPAGHVRRLHKRILQKCFDEIDVRQPRSLLGQVNDLQLHVTNQPLAFLAQSAIPADIGQCRALFPQQQTDRVIQPHPLDLVGRQLVLLLCLFQ